MKWRKMADHVQVSRGFMFLLQTLCLGAWGCGWTRIPVLCSGHGSGVWPAGAAGLGVSLSGSKRKDEQPVLTRGLLSLLLVAVSLC